RVVATGTAEAVREAAAGRALLAEQLTAPVRWVGCMQRGAELAGARGRFIEIGPGTVLAGLLKRIVPGANVVSLGSADEVARFMEAAGERAGHEGRLVRKSRPRQRRRPGRRRLDR